MSYQLMNDKLAVEIAFPGKYQGARFDWTGFITGVELLDGNHQYCVPESLIQGEGTNGIGLCNEFGLSQGIGYDEIAPTQQFSKIGVGLLTKPDDREYQFNYPYSIEPYEVIVEQINAKTIKFVSLPKPCQGYAFRLEKQLTLINNSLHIHYELHNVGHLMLHTTEYCHNFIGIDNHRVSDEYILKFPFPIKPSYDEPETIQNIVFCHKAGIQDQDEVMHLSHDETRTRDPHALSQTGTIISWKEPTDAPFYFRSKAPPKLQSTWLWELIHQPSGVGVRETSQFPLNNVAVWGRGHVISPETFIELKIAPGDVFKWVRSYEFF